MPIARKHNFISNSPIFAEDWLDELEQLYGFFSGSISNNVIIKQNSPNVVLILQNIAVNREVLVLKRGGNTKVSFLGNQQFISYVTDVAPIDVQSTTKVIGLNASYLDDLSLSSFILVGLKQTEFFVSLIIDHFIPDATTFKAPIYIVPAGQSMTITGYDFGAKLDVPTGSTIDLSIRKNGVQLITVQFDRTNGLSGNLNTSLAENDKVSFTIDATSLVDGQMFHNLFCNLKIRQQLSS